ncbi:hypothetical protein [Carnobacterium maltaromaticum]|uniref:hypothetical protein n=1 Tax=Carnobacterium maltaromaticum TaxID=2751 RepID=UPI0009CBE1FE|nr:hypothetical protein [Carnobacterium maltaromaticum]CRH18869.1 conserved hypothetical protein [Carnobacterium maltaromaticum]CRH22995.1 conserved hypothetical protein [Carnobacterium maltaromaticum]
MNESFAVLFVRDNQYYPIALTEEQNIMLQMSVKALLQNKVTLIDQPFGRVVNLAEKLSKDGEV